MFIKQEDEEERHHRSGLGIEDVALQNAQPLIKYEYDALNVAAEPTVTTQWSFDRARDAMQLLAQARDGRGQPVNFSAETLLALMANIQNTQAQPITSVSLALMEQLLTPFINGTNYMLGHHHVLLTDIINYAQLTNTNTREWTDNQFQLVRHSGDLLVERVTMHEAVVREMIEKIPIFVEERCDAATQGFRNVIQDTQQLISQVSNQGQQSHERLAEELRGRITDLEDNRFIATNLGEDLQTRRIKEIEEFIKINQTTISKVEFTVKKLVSKTASIETSIEDLPTHGDITAQLKRVREDAIKPNMPEEAKVKIENLIQSHQELNSKVEGLRECNCRDPANRTANLIEKLRAENSNLGARNEELYRKLQATDSKLEFFINSFKDSRRDYANTHAQLSSDLTSARDEIDGIKAKLMDLNVHKPFQSSSSWDTRNSTQGGGHSRNPFIHDVKEEKSLVNDNTWTTKEPGMGPDKPPQKTAFEHTGRVKSEYGSVTGRMTESVTTPVTSSRDTESKLKGEAKSPGQKYEASYETFAEHMQKFKESQELVTPEDSVSQVKTEVSGQEFRKYQKKPEVVVNNQDKNQTSKDFIKDYGNNAYTATSSQIKREENHSYLYEEVVQDDGWGSQAGAYYAHDINADAPHGTNENTKFESKYTRKDDIMSWLRSYEWGMENTSEAYKIRYLLQCLPKDDIQTLGNSFRPGMSWPAVKKLLINFYCSREQIAMKLSEWNKLVWLPNETNYDLAQRIQNAAAFLLYWEQITLPTLVQRIKDMLEVEPLPYGLFNMSSYTTSTFQGIIQALIRLGTFKGPEANAQRRVKTQAVLATQQSGGGYKAKKSQRPLEDIICWNCKQKGHFSSECPKPQVVYNRNPTPRRAGTTQGVNYSEEDLKGESA